MQINAEEQSGRINQTVEVASKPKARKLSVQLPYIPSPGTIKTALERIRQASVPERVSPDFVSTVLNMKGGTGGYVAPFLKKIGLVASDGTPTELYKAFRNSSAGGSAIAKAIKLGYKPLAEVNEYFYRLLDKELLSLIVQVTGVEPASSTARQIIYSLNALKEFADFNSAAVNEPAVQDSATERDSHVVPLSSLPPPPIAGGSSERLGLNLAYNINLNLPVSTDQAVFNAIFKSLKEYLLTDED